MKNKFLYMYLINNKKILKIIAYLGVFLLFFNLSLENTFIELYPFNAFAEESNVDKTLIIKEAELLGESLDVPQALNVETEDKPFLLEIEKVEEEIVIDDEVVSDELENGELKDSYFDFEENVEIEIKDSEDVIKDVIIIEVAESTDRIDHSSISLNEIASSTENNLATSTQPILSETKDSSTSSDLAFVEQVDNPITINQSVVVSEQTLNDASSSSSSSFTIKAAENEVDNNYASSSISTEFIYKGSENLDTGEDLKALFKTVSNPRFIATWQMLLIDGESSWGRDDSNQALTQILPTGKYQEFREVSICSLVASNGDEANVLAEIFYPENVSHGSDIARSCGAQKEKITLKLIDNDYYQVVCDDIRNNNNNLLSWGVDENNDEYNYEIICGETTKPDVNDLQLYCAIGELAYDDPAGNYNVNYLLENAYGFSVNTNSSFKYLELTNLESDFLNIHYGRIVENSLSIVRGDNIWGTSALPTIRNTGNTRAQLKIWQNDFGLGKSSGLWNIEYSLSSGENELWSHYYPEQTIYLSNILNLSEAIAIDFGILVKQFPLGDGASSYLGEMLISAENQNNLMCSIN